MLSLVWPALLLSLLAPVGCTAPSSRIGEYLTGFQPVEGQTRIAVPLVVDLLIALPEDELGKPTTPSKEALQRMAQRIQKELQESPNIKVRRILPTIIIPAGGLGALTLERIRESAEDSDLSTMMVVVATSQAARKGHLGRLEDQLFARMDAAFVDLATGRILSSDSGQDDYVLAQTYYNQFSYPRLYYRTFTFAGPFTVVDGNPYKALGEAAFSGAADQVGMKFRRLVDPDPTG